MNLPHSAIRQAPGARSHLSHLAYVTHSRACVSMSVRPYASTVRAMCMLGRGSLESSAHLATRALASLHVQSR